MKILKGKKVDDELRLKQLLEKFDSEDKQKLAIKLREILGSGHADAELTKKLSEEDRFRMRVLKKQTRNKPATTK